MFSSCNVSFAEQNMYSIYLVCGCIDTVNRYISCTYSLEYKMKKLFLRHLYILRPIDSGFGVLDSFYISLIRSVRWSLTNSISIISLVMILLTLNTKFNFHLQELNESCNALHVWLTKFNFPQNLSVLPPPADEIYELSPKSCNGIIK